MNMVFKTDLSRFKKHKILIIFLLLIIFIWVAIIAFGSKRYADESYHYRQIRMFHANEFEMAKGLTTLPGYHVILTIPAKILFNDLSIFKIRILTFLIALLMIPLLLLIIKEVDKKSYPQKIITLLLLPPAFVFYPLIYTDIFSALLVLLSFWLALKKKYHLAAIISIASILSRQHNIIWHLFIWSYIYIENYGYYLKIENILNHLKKTFIFLIGIVLFIIFIKINGGIAIGDKGSHPIGIYMGNIYFFIFLSALLFWPVTIKRILDYQNIFKNKKLYIAFLISLIFSFLLFLYPPVLHGYNNDYRYLRNIFLIFSYDNHLYLYALFVFLGTFSLFFLKIKKDHLIIYPFIFLCLAPSWLIEERYTIIPFLFLFLFRETENQKIENMLRVYYLFLCLLLFYSIVKLKIFL